MMVLSLFSWWYTTGWARLAKRLGERNGIVLEWFSVGLLSRTLFAPYRQISAGQVQGPLNMQLRALGDKLFSRIFGAFVRGIFIVIGLLTALIAGVLGLLQLLFWPFVPLLPLVGIVIAAIGWVPS